ncbi:DUF4190 domain-containing protein [Cryobacterium adonitolivorans]|uniref:DUF4190 domain-containing protein n=1 Tax=Cryobacterium adonitolivorans TaxID=1259189 RepID=A0A4R8W9H0_9MICO|nr:DUF4190 domain-containing protein [Cryobacterium adonitolivorans]TFC04339.1 DUF4190 domain-containing protein [Cryobacterium adonitolivorans]
MTERTDGSIGEYPAGDLGDRPGVPVPYKVPPTTPYYGPVAPRTNTLAIVALVTGFCCSIAAVITGHIAIGQIRRTGEAGKGMAIAGLVLGYVSIGFTALLLVTLVFFTAAMGAFVTAVAGATSSVTSSESATSSEEATGQTGAAYFDDGFLMVGTGVTVVDLYIDPMCPYCGQFDIANGDTLAALVDDGTITLRLHSLTFLDQASQGTEYSTRASAALTCEAAINPESTLDYLAALFANQPAEGTTGLSDDELTALSGGSGSIADCVTGEQYHAWSQQNTDDALTGPIPGAELSSIQGTPTVLIDGSQYSGPIDDPQALTDAILGVTG